MTGNQPEIRIATTPAERESCFRLRYQHYVEDLGLWVPGADRARRAIEEPLDATGEVYGAFDGTAALATWRISFPNVAPPPEVAIYDLDRATRALGAGVCVIHKMVIAPAGRGFTLFRRVVKFLMAGLLDRGVSLIFIACRDEMVPLWERMGCVVRFRAVEHRPYGPLTVMRQINHDVPHLERVGSPYAAICRRFAASPAAALLPPVTQVKALLGEA